MLFQMAPLALTWGDLERSKSRSSIFQRAVTWKHLQIGWIFKNPPMNAIQTTILTWPSPLRSRCATGHLELNLNALLALPQSVPTPTIGICPRSREGGFPHSRSQIPKVFPATARGHFRFTIIPVLQTKSSK